MKQARQINLQNKAFQALLYLVLFIVAYIFSKTVIADTGLYKTIQVEFAGLVYGGLQLITNGVSFDAATGNFIYNNKIIQTASSLALKYYFIVFGILAIAPRNYIKSVLVLCVAFIALYISNVLKYLNDVFTPSELMSFLYWVNVSLRYLIVYLVLKYKIDQHSFSRNAFVKLDVAIQTIFEITLHRLLLLICMVPAFAAFFDWFLLDKWTAFVDGLSALILGLSELLLHGIGFSEAFVVDKTINLHNYWLYLGTNCLGVGLMIVFSILIFSIKSPLLNRMIYIPIGIVFIILLNAIRIDAILLHITLNQTPQHLIVDYHDLSNNVYYIVVFLFILVYIGWFQNLKIGKRKS
ncbi:MAG: hypothetical protein KA206_05640 [Paludibacter sp.]|nr:hypothetical protein [Paludibacter sp.]